MAYVLSVMSVAMEVVDCDDVPGHIRHAIDGYACVVLTVMSRN